MKAEEPEAREHSAPSTADNGRTVSCCAERPGERARFPPHRHGDRNRQVHPTQSPAPLSTRKLADSFSRFTLSPKSRTSPPRAHETGIIGSPRAARSRAADPAFAGQKGCGGRSRVRTCDPLLVREIDAVDTGIYLLKQQHRSSLSCSRAACVNWISCHRRVTRRVPLLSHPRWQRTSTRLAASRSRHARITTFRHMTRPVEDGYARLPLAPTHRYPIRASRVS